MRIGVLYAYEVTDKTIKNIVANFAEPVPVDDGMPLAMACLGPPAIAWIRHVEQEGDVLFAETEPTERATEYLKRLEVEKLGIKLCPAFWLDYRDPITGESKGTKLLSARLESLSCLPTNFGSDIR